MCPAQPWSEKSKEEFKCAMDNDDVDEAWKTWANAAGVTVPYAEKQKLQAGWTCGASHREVRRLWKRVRQFQSRGTAQADRLPENELKVLSDLLSLHAEERLSEWKK